MTPVDAAFVILALVVATTRVARRVRTPAPVVFAIADFGAGRACRASPEMPSVRMPPDLALFAFLPPRARWSRAGPASRAGWS